MSNTESNKLPKFGAPTVINFWSLRDGCTINGFIGDIDTQITRTCMRVHNTDSWKWQIVNTKKTRNDLFVGIDQISLDEIGDDMSDIDYE